MRNIGLRSPFIRLSTFSLATAGLLSLAIAPAQAALIRSRIADYQTCANGLLAAGISQADAASSCAASLYPTDLSHCVVNIKNETSIAANDALTGCRRVRRPVELATCVTQIDNLTTGSEPLGVLDYCRRSLLPTRYSACVVGLSQEVDSPVAELLQTCIAAGTRPRNVLPNFIPASQDALTPLTTPIAPPTDIQVAPTAPLDGQTAPTTPLTTPPATDGTPAPTTP
ncbi:MAG TPA: hypothetical protein V6C78_21940 [Crinalium sp.]|jgi:hypothetical protein